MGARWAWFAKCPSGHIYGGFSGGADRCGECDSFPETEIQCSHMWTDDPCNCKELLENPPPPHSCLTDPAVRELCEAAEGAYQMLLLSGKRPDRLRKALEAMGEK